MFVELLKYIMYHRFLFVTKYVYKLKLLNGFLLYTSEFSKELIAFIENVFNCKFIKINKVYVVNLFIRMSVMYIH